jgi:MFS transporter, DHA1 family, multidrug resistance protein
MMQRPVGENVNDFSDASGMNTPDLEKTIEARRYDDELERQTEKQCGPSPQEASNNNEESADASIVEFQGPHDPGNPKNWTVKRRLGITIALAGYVLLCCDNANRAKRADLLPTDRMTFSVVWSCTATILPDSLTEIGQTFASSIFAVCLGPVSEEYNIGSVTAALGVGLFVLVCRTSSE